MTDSILKIQSVRQSLDAIDDDRIPNAEQIEDCLETANESLKEALGYSGGVHKKQEPE
jgi:hypothetical protein